MDNTTDLLQIKIDKARAELSEETRNAIDAVPWRGEILKMRETKGYDFEKLGYLELETELLLCGLVLPEDYPTEIQNRMRISKQEADDLVKEMNNLVFSKIKEELMKNIERKSVPPLLSGEGLDEVNYPPRPDQSRGTPQEGNITNAEEEKKNMQALKSAGIEIVPDLPAAPSAQLPQTEKLELNSPPLLDKEGGDSQSPPRPDGHRDTPPQKGGDSASTILTQKLSGPVKNEVVKTEHFLNNLSKMGGQKKMPIPQAPKVAPVSYPPKGDPYRLSPD